MDLWTISLTAIGAALFCAYFYLTRNFDYFEKLSIPYIKPVPVVGNMGGVILKKKAMPYVIQESYDCHPDARYVGFFDCSIPVILLKDPELVKLVGIKNFDSFPNHKMFADFPSEPLFGKNLFALKDNAWRDMRALLSPAFTSSKMKMMFTTLSRCAIDFTDHLARQNPQPEELDIKEAFGRLTMDVIASAAFGLNVDSMEDRDNEFYRLGKMVSDFSGFKMVKLFLLMNFPWLGTIFGLRVLDKKTSNFFTDAIENTIATRKAQGIVRPDMIQLMMQAKDKKENSDLSLEDMTAQAFIFFLGGFENPSLTISFATYALTINQDIQRKLQAEIDEVIEKGGAEVSYENLHAMEYLDAVINETLRMYPPGAAMDRVGPKSFTLPPALPGLEPLEIKPGQSVWIPLYSLHHDPNYFPNPKKFDPERFSGENKSKINPLTYMPFGLGPRICIANRFALMEVKLALFYLLAKYNLLPCSKTSPFIKLSPKSFDTTPEGGFWLKIEPRK